ncbi:MAG: nitrate reductase molybdenum cofactor assembly chaperone [Curvibacter sp. RIFCSPHIGHO2_12_FULL_63_18]|uniref:nitrate reductase molybdenum cofactor assembly chaperone n=1 Tax=Rhodoferax sp. TaxID=50421 RepID=UPI0008CB6C71|nr:nitrate reductase molybdenum cofactor assembly chaperone [Rhodoferax sp.]OGO95365.1 MAG: nitrate reductase molybdenum cofactor assembly chaperone [Curvibacter sp. GWA2_63_95]OGO99316.1 MAG: nitrate reductase molybdenum cofactor assembly chaperone [Curvibacter sp. RIFCSPHIGHO2_12_FULL_63_18]HCX81118.1 nitrate reductase molybdenum cofactor assembly chaperone [Rhodoferax sp.]
MKDNRYSLRALALLLGYPNAALRDQLPALMEALDQEGAVPAERRAELRSLAAELSRGDPLEVEAQYVETFDRGRATSLHLFEHVHGDSRDRGPAMVDLAQTYDKAGLQLSPDELPDHLCVVLEFASTQPPAVARDFLGEMAHILQSIFSALLKRNSPYAAAVAAVLELSGQRVQAVPFAADEPLDESWAEPEAFDGCSTKGQARPGDAQPIHIVRKAPAAQGVSV